MFSFLGRGHGLFLGKHIHPFTPVGEVVRGAVHAIPEDEPVSTALRLCLKGHRNIPVTDKGGKAFRGMVTSRSLLDYLGGGSLHSVFRKNKHPMRTKSSRLMEGGHLELERIDTVSQALRAFKQTRDEALPLVRGGRLDGVVSEADIVGQISRPTGVRVSEVMTRKPVAARPDHPVSEVAGMLVRGGYRRLPVVRDSFLVGMVTPKDILGHLKASGGMGRLRRDRNAVSSAMNRVVETVGPGDDVRGAALKMRQGGLAMLPVVDSYRLVGVVTQRDILEAM